MNDYVPSVLKMPVADDTYFRLVLLKLINKSWSSNKGNHNREGGLDTQS